MDEESFRNEEVIFSGFVSGIIAVVLGIFHTAWWFLAAVTAFGVGTHALIKSRRHNARVSRRFGRRRHEDTDESLFSSGLRPVNHGTLEEAVQHASPGKQILVEPGDYHEHVMITKSLSIVGEGACEDIRVFVDSPWALMCEETVTLRGLTLLGPEEGWSGILEATEGTLILEDCILQGRVDIERDQTSATIKNCRFQGENGGVQVSRGARSSVEDCTFDLVCGPALTACQGGVANIQNCTITVKESFAVDIREHARADIHDVHVTGGGVFVSDSSDAALSQCRIESSQGNGVSINSQSNAEISGSALCHNLCNGVNLEEATVDMIDCDISNNGRFGVHAGQGARGAIQNCDVEDNSQGAYDFSKDAAMETDQSRE